MTPTPETIAIIATGVTLAALILQQMRSLGARFDRLEARIGRLEAGQQALVERVTRLEAGQQTLEREVTALRGEVKSLARDLAALSERTARIEGAVIGPWRPEEAGTGKS